MYPELDSQQKIVRLQWCAVCLFLLILAGFISYAQFQEYLRVADVERSRLAAQARIVDENLARQLDSANHALESIIKELPKFRAHPRGMEEANEHLLSLTDAMPGVRFIMLTDASGVALASSLKTIIGQDFSYRQYFQAVLKHPEHSILYVSPPFKTVRGTHVVNVSRMIPGPDGGFGGVVTASLEPEFFSILLGSVLYAPDMWAALAHGDGELFLITPDIKGVSGSNLAKPGSFFSRHMASGKAETVLTGTVLTTGEKRMMAQRTIMPAALKMDKSLVVAVCRDLEVMYSGWRKELFVICSLYAIVAFSMLTGLYIYLKRQVYYMEELVRARSAAEQANAAKSGFLANMSHEIRTPMNAVMGLLQLALRTGLDQQQRDYLLKAQGASKTLLTILNDILDFSKVEAGKIELESVPFHLQELFANLVVMLGPAAGDKKVDLQFSLDPELPAVLRGDPLRLQQVLLNLAGNAVKFTEAGGVTVAANAAHVASDVATVSFSVRDTGIGIEPAMLEEIFVSFSQADSSTTRRFGGTGLGLTISRRLVQLMGGELSVESEAGSGSVFHFTVTLPVATDTASTAQMQPFPPLPLPVYLPGNTQSGRLSGLHLLLVEDNPLNQMVAKELLEGEWATVQVASDGMQAIAQLSAAEKPFSAVLMDIQMPGMSGYEAARKIRELPGLNGLPIIAMTAHALPEEREKSFAAGMNGHIDKPIDLEQLVAALLQQCAVVATPEGDDSENASPVSGIDVSGAIRRMGNDRLLYAKIAKYFCKERCGATGGIRMELNNSDTQALAKELHGLKGEAGTLGLMALVDVIANLELLLAQQADSTEVATLIERLSEQFEEACRYLSKVADELEQE